MFLSMLSTRGRVSVLQIFLSTEAAFKIFIRGVFLYSVDDVFLHLIAHSSKLGLLLVI